MAGKFFGFIAAIVLIVLQSGQEVLASGTPQPEQIHISSTGGENYCDVFLFELQSLSALSRVTPNQTTGARQT